MTRTLPATLTAAAIVALTTLPTPAHAASVSFGSGLNTFAIELVDIGDADNDDDTTGTPNPAGKVEYAYRISKYEISEDMINKANAVGGLGIGHDNRGADKPATNVSWNEAARFVNWLNTSEGHQAAYKFRTQPGDVGYNANTNILLWEVGDAGFDAANPFRNSLAQYVLPSADEGYKAAYYDPSTGSYFDYPTGSDSVPDGIDFAGDTSFDAVFFDSGFNLSPNDITDVGVLSPYGTAGQGGNVFEWEESAFDVINPPTPGSARGLRGGSWDDFEDLQRSSSRFSISPTIQFTNFGFRIASPVPEPASAVLLGLGIPLLFRRSRR